MTSSSYFIVFIRPASHLGLRVDIDAWADSLPVETDHA